MFIMDVRTLGTIMTCRGYNREMPAMDVMVSGDDICCPFCFDVVDVKCKEVI